MHLHILFDPSVVLSVSAIYSQLMMRTPSKPLFHTGLSKHLDATEEQ